MWKKQTLTLTHLMKQKRNLKKKRNLKNNFQNTSQELPNTPIVEKDTVSLEFSGNFLTFTPRTFFFFH